MNETQNNSILSTLIFLCIALLIILGLVLVTEEPVPAQPATVNSSFSLLQ